MCVYVCMCDQLLGLDSISAFSIQILRSMISLTTEEFNLSLFPV